MVYWIMALGFVVMLFLAGILIVHWSRESLRAKKGKRMIDAVKKYVALHGETFYWNVDHDINGVSPSLAFQKALAEHNKKVEFGEAKPWDKVVCYAKPTFTFAGSEQTRRPIHTGVVSEFECIVEGVLKELTGVSRNEVERNDYDKAASLIFVRDSRLFVPYSGKVEKPEEQFAFYGQTALHEALKLLWVVK